MSLSATRWAWHTTVAATAKLVLLCLAEHARKPDGVAWPSERRIMTLTGLSERSVRRALRACEVARVLHRISGGARRGDVPRYQLHVPAGGYPQGAQRVAEGGQFGQEGGHVGRRKGATLAPRTRRSLNRKEPAATPEQQERAAAVLRAIGQSLTAKASKGAASVACPGKGGD